MCSAHPPQFLMQFNVGAVPKHVQGESEDSRGNWREAQHRDKHAVFVQYTVLSITKASIAWSTREMFLNAMLERTVH